MKLLFVCSQNRVRSPTAEAIFSGLPGIEARSAGTNHDADHPVSHLSKLRLPGTPVSHPSKLRLPGTPVSADLIEWADVVLVMENVHKAKLNRRFPDQLRGKKLVVLGIPDEYWYMDPELVRILKEKVPRLLKP